ncbi:unnamed protein product [Pedinophyceae sp. YPF-701]|nr:unnamed protein product [Pedinophyceae sp. YPF-701]
MGEEYAAEADRMEPEVLDALEELAGELVADLAGVGCEVARACGAQRLEGGHMALHAERKWGIQVPAQGLGMGANVGADGLAVDVAHTDRDAMAVAQQAQRERIQQAQAAAQATRDAAAQAAGRAPQ